MDLERFFDRVNHDVLIGRLAKKIEDKRMLKILRGFLNGGVMLNGVVVEQDKSGVDRPWNRRFLGFTFTRGRETRRRVSERAVEKAKDRIRELTNRNRGASVQTIVRELTSYLRGWKQYFGLCQVPRARRDLDGWVRRRLRLVQVKQWKRGATAYSRLVAMGAKEAAAVHTAQNLRRWWYAANSPGIQQALPATHFDQLGLPRLA